jgi:predicted phage gp36 major capsid-like protein
MKTLIAVLSLCLLALPAYAQEKKEPSAAQKKQQERMKACNAKAEGKKGDERKAFMSSCLKDAAPSKAQQKQQDRMASCNKEAGAKGMKGDERKKFMSSCLKA